MSTRTIVVNLLLFVSLLIFTACAGETAQKVDTSNNDNDENLIAEDHLEGKNETEENEPYEITEPVTIYVGVNTTEEDFIARFKTPIENEFPNVTLEHIAFAPNRDLIEDQLLVGNVPDIIFGNNLEQLYLFNEYDLLTDHEGLIEKHQFPIELFNSSFIQAIRSYAGGEALWALPTNMTRYALHYNKDIFDLFGVDYPEDGMTWQEILDLSRSVTGERNGQEYIGLHLPVPRILLSTLSVPLVDPETDEPLFTKEPEFTMLFELYESVYGNQEVDPNLQALGEFISERRVAMLPLYYLYSGWTGLQTATEEGMEWDIVTFPIWAKDQPYTPMVGGQWVAVTDQSEHKDAAFQIIKFWLSEEQIIHFLEGPVSVPFNPEKTAEFVNSVSVDEAVRDKNIPALFKHPTLDKQPKRSKYESLVYNILVAKVNEFISPESPRKDIQTTLKELQEEAARAIAEEKGKG